MARGGAWRSPGQRDGMSLEYVALGLALVVTLMSNRIGTKLTALAFLLSALASGDTLMSACVVSVVSCAIKLAKHLISPSLKVSAVDLRGMTAIVTGANSGCCVCVCVCVCVCARARLCYSSLVCLRSSVSFARPLPPPPRTRPHHALPDASTRIMARP